MATRRSEAADCPVRQLHGNDIFVDDVGKQQEFLAAAAMAQWLQGKVRLRRRFRRETSEYT